MINDFAARKHEIYVDVFMSSFFPCFLRTGTVKVQLSFIFSTDADDVNYPQIIYCFFWPELNRPKHVHVIHTFYILKKLLTWSSSLSPHDSCVESQKSSIKPSLNMCMEKLQWVQGWAYGKEPMFLWFFVLYLAYRIFFPLSFVGKKRLKK